MDLQAIIITSIFGVITALVSSGIWALLAQRRITAAKVITEEETAKKVKAETDLIRSQAAQIIQDSSGDLVMEYKKQVSELREELELTRRNLTSQIEELRSELNDAYAKIKHQDVIIRGLNKQISELRK